MNRYRPQGLVFGLSALIFLTACGFGAESASRPVPERQQEILSIAFGSPLSLNGEARVYLPRLEISAGPNLGSVPRAIDETDEQAFFLALVNELLAGPTADESASGFGSALPTGTKVLSVVPAVNRVTIDLTGPLALLTDSDKVVAVAQIVYTMSEGFFIREVMIKIDGQNIEWPRSDGTRTSGPLTIFDFPTAAITSQPAYPGIFATDSQV